MCSSDGAGACLMFIWLFIGIHTILIGFMVITASESGRKGKSGDTLIELGNF